MTNVIESFGFKEGDPVKKKSADYRFNGRSKLYSGNEME
jgi:hypothetical protein